MTFNNEYFDFNSLSHKEILDIFKKHNIILTVDEALKIQNEMLKRPPTLTECVLWSIQSSEHCSYKSSRQHLKQLPTEAPNVILGPKEDSGIVAIAKDNEGRRYGAVISHESHNHPSQIVPFEGAATGVGGNVRDVCCMGAEVVAVADSLRFGDINRSKTHSIFEGVVAGVGGYGNAIGVPNIAGDVYFDSGYNDNCLVTVVTLGVLREDHVIHSYAPKNAEGYHIILVGKATDNSGFAGASFASIELDENKKEQNKGAVQEPNAFLERHILKATYALCEILQKQNLIDRVGFKDLGAGGIACASVELAEAGGYGAEVNLDLVPVSMPNLHPSVILCSETQERFMWVVPPELSQTILDHYNKTFEFPLISKKAQATVIGFIRSGDRYTVNYQGTKIIDASAKDVTKGLLYERPIKKPDLNFVEPNLHKNIDINELFLKILSHENVASRAIVFETYDKQVQGRTIIEAGCADAGVLQPFNSDRYPHEIQSVGIVLKTDQNPRYNKIDPYIGAVNAVVEASRNVVAVGAKPEAITDCLCYGNPEKPEHMWAFTEGVRGIKDACEAIGLIDYPDYPLPIVSGNVSLYNESKTGSIPPSPMIACLGSIDNVKLAITPGFKKTDSLIVLVGERKNELGGSIYYQLFSELGANVPKPDLKTISKEINAVYEAINEKLVLAAHDISDGGVAISIAEMSILSGIGCNILITGNLSNEVKLFSESGGFVLEIEKNNLEKISEIFMKYNTFHCVIGKTTSLSSIVLCDDIKITIAHAKDAWVNGLRSRILR